MAKVVGYVRVSTTKQSDQGASLEVQQDKVRAYCALHDLELLEVVVDRGISASTLDRPGMKRVLELLEDGAVGGLVVFKLDRLTRSIRDLGALLDPAMFGERWKLHSVSESLDTGSAMGRFFVNLLGVISQWERETIVERTALVMGELRASGRRVGTVPYGFRAAKDGRLVVDPDESAVALRIMRLTEGGGMSFRGIADELNRAGHRTRKGTEWTHVQVKRISESFGEMLSIVNGEAADA